MSNSKALSIKNFTKLEENELLVLNSINFRYQIAVTHNFYCLYGYGNSTTV